MNMLMNYWRPLSILAAIIIHVVNFGLVENFVFEDYLIILATLLAVIPIADYLIFGYVRRWRLLWHLLMFTVAVISFPPLAFGTIIAFGFYFDFITRVLLVFLTALSAVTGLGLIAANFLFDFKSLEYLSPYWRAETYRNNAVKFWSIQIGLIIILILFWWEI